MFDLLASYFFVMYGFRTDLEALDVLECLDCFEFFDVALLDIYLVFDGRMISFYLTCSFLTFYSSFFSCSFLT